MSLFFDLGLVDQHHGDVVADRIHAMALDALQAALIGLHLNRGFADGAYKYFEQILTDSHSDYYSLARVSRGPQPAESVGRTRGSAVGPLADMLGS